MTPRPTDPPPRRSLIGNAAFARLCRARDLLAADGDARISIREAAHAAEVSPYHFIRRFRAAFGETPHAFRTRLRLERAKHLLAVRDLPVTDVCLAVGFSSLGSFSHLFARRVGMAPARYRRRVREMARAPGRYPAQMIPHCYASMYCAPETRSAISEKRAGGGSATMRGTDPLPGDRR